MISKADMPRGDALTRLFERTRRAPVMRVRKTTSEHLASDPSHEPIPCDDADAALDVAALQIGNLSDDGIARLAAHVVACESCRALVGILVRDALDVESSGERILK